MFQNKRCSGNTNTHILCLIIIFLENRAVYQIIWENTLLLDRPLMTIRRMCCTVWITETTDTHSDFVTALLLHDNNMYAKALWCYFVRSILPILSFFCRLVVGQSSVPLTIPLKSSVLPYAAINTYHTRQISLLYNEYRDFPGGKERPGRDADPRPPLVPWS